MARSGDASCAAMPVRKLINPRPMAVMNASSTPRSILFLFFMLSFFVATSMSPKNMTSIALSCGVVSVSSRKMNPRMIVTGNSISKMTSTTDIFPFLSVSKFIQETMNPRMPSPRRR